jgi:anaerobic magnesium-protoporphyrin IX monomethyl ester cyclase
MNVALVNVVMGEDYQYEQEVPLGLAAVGAFLREQGYPVRFHQCFAAQGEEELRAAAAVDADVYGFQLNMANYLSSREVAKRLKEVKPNAIIIGGGPFLVSRAEEILKAESVFDFIVVGEGEWTMLELLKALQEKQQEFSAIEGLVWRGPDGCVTRNALRTTITDLDALPFFARDLLEQAPRDPVDNGLLESVRMVTSRGCVSNCTFCCVNLYSKILGGKRWRGQSPKRVVDELEYLSREFGMRLVNFSDSSFEDPGQLGKERSREICEEIIRRGIPLSAKIYLRCETMRNDEDIDLLRLYKRAGVDVVIFGAESASDYELKLYGKNANVADNFRTAKILRGLDLFYLMAGFIMFGPYSTPDNLRKNIAYLHEWGFSDNAIAVSSALMLFRDSKLYQMLREEDMVIESGKYWELPKYRFYSPIVERAKRHWQDIFNHYPSVKEVNALQVNIGNLVARMTNPMNEKILVALRDDFAEFKTRDIVLRSEFGKLQHDYFLHVLERIEQDCADEELASMAEEFFGKTYARYLPIYRDLLAGFLQKVRGRGFSLSGLLFHHFFSHMFFKER